MINGLSAKKTIVSIIIVILFSAIVSFAQTPPWKGSKTGRDDIVLKPWTPVEAKDNSIFCWGRKYQFDNLPFPQQVFTQDKAVLSSPIRIIMKVSGEDVVWKPTDSKPALLTTPNETAAKIVRASEGAGIIFNGTATVEYDGMMRIDFSVGPKDPCAIIDSFLIEIPVKTDWATLRYYWPLMGNEGLSVSNAGAVGSEIFKSCFRPFWWLGNEDGGLCWFAESDQGWDLTDEKTAIEIVPGPNEVVLRLHIWDKPKKVYAVAPKKFTMGLQATPVKPWPQDWHKNKSRHAGNLFYGLQPEHRKENYGTQVNDEFIDYFKDKGVKVMWWGADWAAIHDNPVPHWPDKFRDINDEVRKRGMKAIPYMGFEIADILPEFPIYGDEVRVPMTHVHVVDKSYSSTMPPHKAYAVCYASHWADFFIEGVTKLKKEYGIEGLYLDGTATPLGCCNYRHGCGYMDNFFQSMDAPGQIKRTYPIFAVRDLMKRLRTIFPEEQGGVIVVHNSTCLIMPTIGFASCYLDGENIANMTPGHPTDVVSLAAFRAEFMGKNWGVPNLHQNGDSKALNTEQCFSISLLHQVIPKNDSTVTGQIITSRYWKIFEDFDADIAEFFPYWSNSSYVKVSNPDVYVSFFRRLDNGSMLLMVSNLGRVELPNASVTIDYSALNLAGIKGSTGKIFRYKQPDGKISVDSSGTIKLSLPMCSPVVMHLKCN